MALLSMSRALFAAGWLLLSLPAHASPDPDPLLGKEWVYTVKPADTLSRIAARQGVDLRRLLAINGLSSRKPLKAGQKIHLSTRHIVPEAAGATIVVNIPDGLLFHYGAGTVDVYPVGLGEPIAEKAATPERWRTPTGTFKVVEKRKDPVWNVPPSIQEELREEGKEVLTKVAPGPKNPLGTRWIGLSRWGYGIHGTNVPSSIGRYSTHGCVRMRSEHVERIFDAVSRGTVVRIDYAPAKVARVGEAVFLEVSRDVYDRIPDMNAHVERMLRDAGVWEQVDPAHVKRVVKGRWGVATRVDRGAPVPFLKLAPAPKATSSATPSAAPSPEASSSATPLPASPPPAAP